MKRAGLLLIHLMVLSPHGLEAYGKKVEQQAAWDDIQSSYSRLQHQVSNSKSEIKTFEERLINFELMLESLREELAGSKEQQKETIQARSHSLELRIASLEQTSKALSSDLKKMSDHLQENKQKLLEMDKNFSNLQSAVASLIEAFQEKTEGNATRYTVKNGDSLDKIAKAHHTSVQAIKEYNGMNSDKIIVGKTIKIPPRT